MIKILNKMLIIALLAITILNISSNIIYAAVEVDINKAYLKKIGQADSHLKYYREDDDEYRYLICSIVGYYDEDKEFHPAYCMNKNLTGAEDTPYNVTIDSLLNNDAVWRVVKNGYPYKSAKEMGLSSDYDAYAVTKWAVYCILGESNIKYYKAEEDDKEAVAMLKKLKELVNIGLTGKEKQDSNPLSASKVGELIEDENGEYYSQEYKVTSTASFSSYKISSIEGLPEGAYTSDLKGNKKTSFNSGENFKIMIPKSKLTSNINVKFELSAECKSYVILEGKTTVKNTQNYVLTAGEYATAKTNVNLKITTNTGKIKIIKTDSETKQKIEGVEFALKDSKGNQIATATTNSKGEANFTGLYQGSYTLVETKANENYIITESEFDVDVKYNETTTKEIENGHKKGNLKIYKVDEDNTQIGLGNVEFELYSKEQKKTIGTYTTDANGEIYIENLRTGDYLLKEKNTNKWYNLINDLDIKVEWEEDNPLTEVTVKNELKKGQVKVIKVDKDNNQIKLQGVTFDVIDSKGNKLEEITTDANGEAVTSKYSVRDYDKLYLKETSTNKQYKLNDNVVEAELKANEITTVQVENEVKKGKIKIIKVDKDNNEIKLQGVKFEIYNENNELVETLTTDANGEAVTSDLPITHQYTVKETQTNKDYVLNDKTVKVELQEDEISEIKFENEKKKGQVKVIKVDKDNNEIKLKGVEFNVLNSKGEIVDNIITDDNGEAITKELPIDEEYTLVETKTLDNYILTEKTQTVKLQEGQITDVTFENKKIKGQIKIIKTSKDDNNVTGEKAGTPLKDVEFEIYNSNNEKVEKIVTDENGIAISKELEKGTYYVKEISTNEWYILNTDTQEATISKDGQIVELNITNESKNPDVDITKSGPDEAEAGSEIEYDVSVRNTGNTSLDEFMWKDIIPTDYIKVTKFSTGTYNQNLTYNLYYKTNLSDEDILMMEGLSTQENYEIDFSLELAENEYITEIKLEFGTVDVGFASNENPHIYATVNAELKSGDVFENTAQVSGIYNNHTVNDVSKWKTKVYKILPVTGF